MFDRIIFTNNFHNGDIHVSRTFVKEIISKIPAKEYRYVHNNNSKITEDIDNLQVVRGSHDQNYAINIQNNCLFINTWYRASRGKYHNQFGSTINTLYNFMTNELNSFMKNNIISEKIDYYFPKISYNKLVDSRQIIKTIDEFYQKNSKIVLICDNDTLSGQGIDINFNNFNNIIKKFPDINFVSTNKKISKQTDNLIYFDELSKNLFTLNEISYLSTLCDVVIGRCSGPHSFCHVDENFRNPNKTLISFCNVLCYDFGVNKILDIEKCNFINYNFYNEEVEKNIITIINEKY